ncbi:Hypothetical protein PBC10988_0450 [Planctomycetales bacterium 10988]|nr:Hypothetical protein PBC10988_0450 [Planctomycetales bacterium 10988]
MGFPFHQWFQTKTEIAALGLLACLTWSSLEVAQAQTASSRSPRTRTGTPDLVITDGETVSHSTQRSVQTTPVDGPSSKSSSSQNNGSHYFYSASQRTSSSGWRRSSQTPQFAAAVQSQPSPWNDAEVIPSGEVVWDGQPYQGVGYSEAEFVGCDPGRVGCDPCQSTGCGCGSFGCDECQNWIGPNDQDVYCGRSCQSICDGWHWAQDLTLFSGSHGFKGPLDLGRNGNFGIHYGINWAFPFWHRYGIGAQVGGRVTHSNFSGDGLVINDDDHRTQYFSTVGFFRRWWEDTCGWQYGIVYDHLEDSFYDDIGLSQVRAELSRIFLCVNEIGIRVSSGVENDFVDDLLNDGTGMTNGETTVEVVDQYVLFYRRKFETNSEARIWVGGTSNSDLIIGGDAHLLLSKSFAVQTNFNYLLPEEGANTDGMMQESWNVSIDFVWYPGRTGLLSTRSRYRPLFNVANNSTFLVDRPSQNGN